MYSLTYFGGSSKPLIQSRNFDPESRSVRKHAQTEDDAMQDTVEKEVKGLAEQIIAEDETRRAQELASLTLNIPILHC